MNAFDANGKEVKDLFTLKPGTEVAPVPEPTTSSGIALATAGLIYLRRQRQRQGV